MDGSLTRVEELAPQVRALLANTGMGPPESVTRVAGGRNNQMYKVRCGGRNFAVKRYHRDPQDSRDRLAAETAFLSVIADCDAPDTPQIFGIDAEHGLALLEWIDGTAIESVTPTLVQSALRFVERINGDSLRRRAVDKLRCASHSAFRLRDHAAGLHTRVIALREELVCPPPLRQTAEHTLKRLERAVEFQMISLETQGVPDDPLTMSERILSPSDFGFHNALLRDQAVVFIDFEYAGWDDPAKLLCDFFLQPQVPVPGCYLPEFTSAVAAACHLDLTWLEHRVKLLTPIYQLAWTCITLNVLHPMGLKRRLAAADPTDVTALVARQLTLATHYLESAPN